MTLGQLEEMSNAEYNAWAAFYVFRKDIQDREMERAKHGG